MDHTFRDLSTLTRWLRGLLLADAALSVLSVAADLSEDVETGLLTKDTLDIVQIAVYGSRLVD